MMTTPTPSMFVGDFNPGIPEASAKLGSLFVSRATSITYIKTSDSPNGWIPILTITRLCWIAIRRAVACVRPQLEIARDAYAIDDPRAFACLAGGVSA